MVGGWRIALVLAALVVSLSGAPAGAQTRLALVIGNSNYRAVTPLPNPVNDARAVADELKTAAFDVTQALDLGQADMRRAIKDFAAKISAKGGDTVALVYYAGHGVQVDGENFIVPVDAKIQSEADIPKEAVRLADVMSALAAVPSKMRIVILDACRNNPFATSKQTRGLAIVDAPTGSIVAYSTAPGTEATDGAGAHSPYTAAFIEVAQQPRLQIEQLFKQVRLKVHEATKGRQTPWESSSLTSDFWFLPTDEAPAAVVASAVKQTTRLPQQRPATAPQVATLPTQPTRLTQPATVADQAAQVPPIPPTPAADAAQAQQVAPAPQVTASAQLPRPVPLPAAASPSHTLPPPPPGYAPPPPAPVQVADLRAMPPDEAYDYAVMEDSVPVYEEFLLVYPNDPRAEWVRTTLALRVDAIAWRYASVVNTPEAYAAYVARYPGGVYVDEAVRLRVRPRLRPIDVVIAPRIIAPPPAPRIALPLIQMRRTANAPIVLPVVYSRPGRFNPSARLLPGQRLPAFNPATGARFNAATATPGPYRYPRERMVYPNLAPAGPLRSSTVNAVNVPTGPNGVAPYRPPVAGANPQLQPGPPARLGNQRFRPVQQNVQLAPRAKGLPPEKCVGRRCRR
jgi:caspase domain-containing protein